MSLTMANMKPAVRFPAVRKWRERGQADRHNRRRRRRGRRDVEVGVLVPPGSRQTVKGAYEAVNLNGGSESDVQ
jgi:hypothetical protein